MDKERAQNLRNWTGEQRRRLIDRLRTGVHTTNDKQKEFLNKLLDLMERQEFEEEKNREDGISVEDAEKIFGVVKQSSADNPVYLIVHRFKENVEKANRKLPELNPGVYLTDAPYAIEATNNPPGFGKKLPNKCIALLLADATHWFVGEVIEGVNQECRQHGYDLIVDVSKYSAAREAERISVLSQSASGLLLVPVGSTCNVNVSKTLRTTPCVLVDRYFPTVPEFPYVVPDDRLAGRHAARFLKYMGCSRVVIVTHGSDFTTNLVISPLRDRIQGCEDELANYPNIDVAEVSAPEAGERSGFDALKNIRGGLRSHDGIFALTDRLAAGCRAYLADHHPDMIDKIISVEGQPFGDFMRPPLVSIRFNNFETGRLAAQVLIKRIDEFSAGTEDKTPPQHHLIPPILLVPSGDPIKRDEIPLTEEAVSTYGALLAMKRNSIV